MADVQIIDLTGVSTSAVSDPKGYANEIAKQKAAEQNKPVQVKMKFPKGEFAVLDAMGSNTGAVETIYEYITSDIQQPPERPKDIEQSQPGNPKPPTTTDQRVDAETGRQAAAQRGTSSEADDETDRRSASPGSGNFKEALGAALGAARQLTGMIGGMEALMMGLPNALLGKFTSLLPPIFKSFLPVGAVLGIATRAPVSLNSMMSLVGGAALGAVAGQALRSVSGGIPLSGYAGRIGAQTIATVAGNQVLSSIAGNVAGNVANQLGTTPGTAAVIANTVGIVSNIALNNKNLGIPVSSQVLGLAANVALSSAGIRTAIPTNIFGAPGVASAINPISSLVGNFVGASIPMLPGNLSLGNIGSLAGIGQNLSPAFAENLIPRSQLGGLLPPNLSAQIPGISPRISAPGSVNDIEMRQRLAPRESTPQDVKPRPDVKPEPGKEPAVTGTDNGRIPYEKMISKYYTLGKLCNATDSGFNHNIVPQLGLTVDDIIFNLSYLATNVLDQIVEKIGKPPFITSGFRRNGVKRSEGNHGRGTACDISWGNNAQRKHFDVVHQIRQLGIACQCVAIESSGGKNWIHLAHGAGAPGSTPNGIVGGVGDFHLAGGGFQRGFKMV